jgi:hypothetical protein
MAEQKNVDTTKTATMHYIDTILSRARVIWVR